MVHTACRKHIGMQRFSDCKCSVNQLALWQIQPQVSWMLFKQVWLNKQVQQFGC